MEKGTGTILDIDYTREVLVLEIETPEGPQVYEVPFSKISRDAENNSIHIDCSKEEFETFKKTEVQLQ